MPSSIINYQPIYNKSWALIVGVDEYKHFPPLTTAVKGAQAVAGLFREQLGFEVTELYDEQATRLAILQWFDQITPQPDDRIMFYFGGHGFTRPLKRRDQGYLALADSQGHVNALAVDVLLDEAEATLAKHILYLLDACFSGLVFGGREADIGVERTVDYLLTRSASYAITAGGAEVVDDAAAGDYSLFTHYLLKAFEDQSLLADGVLRAKEIGNYLEEHVTAHRRGRALPNHGYLHGSGDGDFVFSWDTGPRLSPELEYTLHSNIPEVRWGAVAHLINIAKGDESEQVLIARERLEEIGQADPDSRVRLAARSFFDEENALREAKEAEERARKARVIFSPSQPVETPIEKRAGQARPRRRLAWIGGIVAVVVIGIIIGVIALSGGFGLSSNEATETPSSEEAAVVTETPIEAAPMIDDTPTPTEPAPTEIPPTKPGGADFPVEESEIVLFEDDFEDAVSTLDNWIFDYNDDWKIVQDGVENHVLEGTGNHYSRAFAGSVNWTQYALEFKAQIVEMGTAEYGEIFGCLFHVSGGKDYQLIFNSDSMNLGRHEFYDWVQLTYTGLYSSTPHEWMNIRVEVSEDTIEAFVNETSYIKYIDLNLLSQGRIGINVAGTPIVRFDDVRVVDLSSGGN